MPPPRSNSIHHGSVDTPLQAAGCSKLCELCAVHVSQVPGQAGRVATNPASLILFGILLSYLPQHYRIISLRSSFGISPYFVLLGTTSATSGFANILVLPRSARDVACCQEINGLACLAGLLGILQVGLQTLCFYVM